jgi:hypothetical protein
MAKNVAPSQHHEVAQQCATAHRFQITAIDSGHCIALSNVCPSDFTVYVRWIETGKNGFRHLK